MRLCMGFAAVALLWLAGCGTAESQSPPAPVASAQAAAPASVPAEDATPTDAPVEPDADAGDEANADTVHASLVPVPIVSGKAALTPENTSIRFVGIHLPPKAPDPRTGGFDEFQGEVAVNPADRTIESLRVEIDATSLWTEVGGRLTNHLKSEDFFEVREYPTAEFQSTRIEPGEAGQVLIVGNLTLHGQTKEIRFPADVRISDQGLTLHSKFTIQRDEFGMTYGPSQVGNDVELTAVVGQPNR